jgi:hypothetical protein
VDSGFGNSIYWTLPVVTIIIHFTTFLSPFGSTAQSWALGRLHEDFRFVSVTRFRTVGRTPWTGDQLVARPLLTPPDDCDDDDDDKL